MKDRLRIIMQEYGVNSSRLAEKLGVQRSGISHILSGRNKPGYEFISSILEHFPEIDANWLITGKGTMKKGSYEGGNREKESDKSIPVDIFSNLKDNNQSQDIEQKPNNKKEESAGYKSKQNDISFEEVESVLVLYRNGNFKIYRNN